MNRIFIVKLWALGDIVMATPLLDALRAAHPQIHITWATEKDHAEVLRGHPKIDELLALDTGAWRRQLRRADLAGWCATAARLRRDLRARRFDAVINCHPEKWWSALLCVAPVRVGLYPGTALPASSGRVYTHSITRPPRTHATDHYLRATRALGVDDAGTALSLGPDTEAARAFCRAFHGQHGLTADRPLILLTPYTTRENKNWEDDRYARLIDRLAQERGVQTIVSVAPRDAARGEALASLCRRRPAVATDTSLPQFVSLVRHADLTVCADTSALHIAAAVGTPFVALFGPTPADLLAPRQASGTVLRPALPCAPCDRPTCAHTEFRACMKQITVEEALDACRPFLEKRHA